MYELDLTLRNNITTEEHPLGVYHPHEELHHIKKENIGLIEVMGLAVLPARLKGEMELTKRIYHRRKKTSEAMIKLQNTQTGQMPFYQSTTMLQKKISNRFWNRKSEKYFAKYSKTQVYINAQMKELKPLNVSFPHSDGYTSDKLLLWQYIPSERE